MIYFIQDSEGHIKIGYSLNTKKRLQNLSTDNSSKLKLLADIPGSRSFENKLHNKFSHLKVHGEWYKSENELLLYIEELKNNPPIEENRQVIILPKMERMLITMGENIRLARLRRNFSAAIVAERAGITRPTLRNIETGHSGVSIGCIANVLQVLGLEGDLGKLGLDDVLGRKLQDLNMRVRRRASKKE